MLKLKVLVLFCAIFSVALATLGSDLDEDDFRSLKGTDDDESEYAELQNDLDEGDRTFYSGGL